MAGEHATRNAEKSRDRGHLLYNDRRVLALGSSPPSSHPAGVVLGLRHSVSPAATATAFRRSSRSPRSRRARSRSAIAWSWWGAGFPQGRAAHVTFRGTLLRPGRRPCMARASRAEGVVTSSDHIEIVVSEPLEDRFCGHGDHALHTTMNGDVEVAFASSAPGAPPLVGVMHGMTLDVSPSSVRASVWPSANGRGRARARIPRRQPGAATPRGLPDREGEPWLSRRSGRISRSVT